MTWCVISLCFPRYVVNGIERILLPLADIPPVGTWLVDVTPGRTIALIEGDTLDITARLRSASGLKARVPVPELIWQDGAGAKESSARGGEHAALLPGRDPSAFTFKL